MDTSSLLGAIDIWIGTIVMTPNGQQLMVGRRGMSNSLTLLYLLLATIHPSIHSFIT